MSQTLRYDLRGISSFVRRSTGPLRYQHRSYSICLLSSFRSGQTSKYHQTYRNIHVNHEPPTQLHPRLQHTAAVTRESSGTTKDTTNDEAQAPQPPLAIVFTDIVKSTAIWEKNAEAMGEAMTIHDDLIRKLTKAYSGYEVKQNGDGFMIAFQDALAALKFCLSLQLQLQEQRWPEELLKLGPASPIVKKQGDEGNDELQEIVLWKGLRLRASAHFGEPLTNWNEIIHRMDYLGPAINRAARYVSVCEGGQIIVSQEFLDELNISRKDNVVSDGPLFSDTETQTPSFQEIDLKDLSHDDNINAIPDTKFELLELGERHFKGVPDQQKLFVIMPKSLHGRLDYFPRQMYVQPSKGNLIEGG